MKVALKIFPFRKEKHGKFYRKEISPERKSHNFI